MKTVERPFESIYKEKGSKFISLLIPVTSEEKCQDEIERIRKEHHKARHVCHAYRLGHDAALTRSSDDGEPRNSAGTPIHNQLISADMTNVLLIVVRYFGGTKLGRPGLVNAYKESARNVIKDCKSIDFISYESVEITFPYGDLGLINTIIERNQYRLDMAFYDDSCRFNVSSSNMSRLEMKEIFSEIQGVEIK